MKYGESTTQYAYGTVKYVNFF